MSKMRLSMIKGERYGRLVFLESLGIDDDFHSVGRFLCDCGVVCRKRLAQVRSSISRSCGCLRRETSNGQERLAIVRMRAAREKDLMHALVNMCMNATCDAVIKAMGASGLTK